MNLSGRRASAPSFTILCCMAFSLFPSAFGRIEPKPPHPQSPEQQEFFEKKIRPIFANSCQGCHNAKMKTAGLDLSSVEGFSRGGDRGPVANKDKPEESRLLKVIRYDGELKMPPTGKLKDGEIETLVEWMKAGAPWGDSVLTAATAPRPKNSSIREFTESEKGFWSFQPIGDPAPPAVKNQSWIKAPIDRFVLSKLEEKNLKPAAPADKLTLLRRATFDLTGLPPTESEMHDFLADRSPDAFKKVVERLLSSQRYGEHWGRHWLDVARYADSTGNDEDHRYPFAWKYRDYVIEAFNNDLPYDRFIREQVAGDLLPDPDGKEVHRRGIIATGFLALGPKAVAQQDKKKMLYDVYDEQVDVVSKAFLGVTLACARCHNHKFDPILTRDYYSMLGVFASTRSFTDPDAHVSVVFEKPLVPKVEFERYRAARKEHSAKENQIRLAIEEIVDEVKDAAVGDLSNRVADFFSAARKVYRDGAALSEAAGPTGLPESQLQRWVDFLKPGEKVRGYLHEWHGARTEDLSAIAQAYQRRFQNRFTPWHERMVQWRAQYHAAVAEHKSLPERPKFEAGDDRFFSDIYFDGGPFTVSEKDPKRFSPEQWTRLTTLRQEQERIKKSAPQEPDMACAIEDGERVAQKVFIRGDYGNSGEDAPQGFPAILARFDTKPSFTGSGRLQLAEWMTQPEHPLTARVMVNRVWLWHFGEGLVRTPDNLGKMGERPTNPELLDFLARQFVRSGWSVKAMHRMILLSSAYQMSSVNPFVGEDADPENRLLTRFNRRRLAVEEIRDGLLVIDGTLDLTMGGTLQTGRGTDGENNQARLSLNPEKLTRRTVYLPLRRANLPTLLNLFDFGDATSAAGKRQLTNVATQALFWLNSDFVTDRSKGVAKALLDLSAMDDRTRVASAYLRITNRQAAKNEIDQALKYVEGFKQKFPEASASQKAWQSFCRVLMASSDFIYVD